MKYTFEEAVKLLAEFGNEVNEYLDGWLDHEHLGPVKTLSSEIVGYYEGNVDYFKVVQFENCDEPIGYSYSSNSWDDYRNEAGTFHKVHKEAVEVWKVTK